MKKQLLKKCVLCALLLVINIALLVTTTYAWFSDNASSSNNKVFAGTLITDVLIKEDTLKANLVSSEVIGLDEDIPESLDDFKYVRKFLDGSEEVYYYASRIPSTVGEDPIDTSILNIPVFEPGQAIVVPVTVKTSGDLAIKAAGAVRVEGNKTGLEVFMDEHPNINDTLSSVIDDDSTPTGKASVDNDVLLLNTLLSSQAKVTSDKYDYEFNGKKFVDNGKELEDAIVVYLLDDIGEDIDVDRKELGLEKVQLNKPETIRESKVCFGTLKQFEYLTTHGPEADIDNGTPLDLKFIFDAYYYKNEGIIPSDTSDDYMSQIESVVLSPNEEYMALYNSYDANLYDDYQRYLSYASGYCIPVEAFSDDQGKIPNDGIETHIYDNDGKVIATKEHVSEIDTINFLLYMPLDAGNEYQNASISLALGATATQVEYEMDDTDCMIYDKSANDAHSHEYTTIKYLSDKGEVKTIKIPKISYTGNVSFDCGTHGEYDTTPVYEITNADLIDLSSEEYRPNTYLHYRFIGYKFNENMKKFICCYEFDTPYKGDIIVLDDNNEYRVLKVDGTKIFVMGMENGDSAITGLYETKKLDELRFPLEFDGYVAIKYDGLDIDTYLNDTWYSSLNEGDTVSMYNAIDDTHIYQNVYAQSDSPLNGNSIIHTFDVGNRKIFPIDINDIYEYFGTETLNQDELYEFFYGKTNINNLDKPINIWLRSSSTTGESITAFAVKADNSIQINYHAVDQTAYIRPAFVIDLNNDGVSYSYPSQK